IHDAARVGCTRRPAMGAPDEWPSRRVTSRQNPAYRPADIVFLPRAVGRGASYSDVVYARGALATTPRLGQRAAGKGCFAFRRRTVQAIAFTRPQDRARTPQNSDTQRTRRADVG